jgi:hypothetical protein
MIKLVANTSIRPTVWRGISGNVLSDYGVGKKKIWWGFSRCECP